MSEQRAAIRRFVEKGLVSCWIPHQSTGVDAQDQILASLRLMNNCDRSTSARRRLPLDVSVIVVAYIFAKLIEFSTCSYHAVSMDAKMPE
jgi:hypothetical protein